jgi:hypothetical protein
MGDWYEKQAQELISNAEGRRDDSIEDFYRGLRRVRDEIDERLQMASDELDEDVANEVLG